MFDLFDMYALLHKHPQLNYCSHELSLILVILFFSGFNGQDLLFETKFESSILLVNKIYSVNAAPLILITIYLLYTLIVVAKIIETFKGPLRSLT